MMTRARSNHTIPSPGERSDGASFRSDHGAGPSTVGGNGFDARAMSTTFRSTSSAASSYDHSTIVVTREAVDHVIHDPIASGFLAKYCTAHFCSENMRFVIEIDRFQDQFMRDKSAWPRSNWKMLDIELDLKNNIFSSNFDLERDFLVPLKNGTLIGPELWPSKILTREAVIEWLKQIWETFLAKDAKYWICIPSTALINTIRRIKMIHIYGREVFTEALIDPIKTIEKDIYPRFILSDEYRLFVSCVKTFENPCAADLKLSKPPFIILQRYQLKEIEKNLIKFTLNDLMDDQILYGEFLKYLEKIVSSENLLCIRAIRIFRECFESPVPAEKVKSFDHAWIVYRYFIASGAPYEISVSYRKKKEVLRKLADPHLEIFDSIEQSAISALKSHYASFMATKEYHDLYRTVISKKNSITSPGVVAPGKVSTMKLPSANSNDENSPALRTNCFSMR